MPLPLPVSFVSRLLSTICSDFPNSELLPNKKLHSNAKLRQQQIQTSSGKIINQPALQSTAHQEKTSNQTDDEAITPDPGI